MTSRTKIAEKVSSHCYRKQMAKEETDIEVKSKDKCSVPKPSELPCCLFDKSNNFTSTINMN